MHAYIFSVLIYVNSKENASDIELFLTLCSTYVFSIILVIGSTLAEEKEYKTLEALILCPLYFIEVIIGKSIIPILIGSFNYIMGCWFLLELILHEQISNLISLLFMGVFAVLLGSLIDMASKNITQVNLVFIPIFVFVALPILYQSLSEYNNIFSLLKYLPSAQQYAFFISDETFALSISMISLWLLLLIYLNYYFYRKIITDNYCCIWSLQINKLLRSYVIQSPLLNIS